MPLSVNKCRPMTRIFKDESNGHQQVIIAPSICNNRVSNESRRQGQKQGYGYISYGYMVTLIISNFYRADVYCTKTAVLNFVSAATS